MSDDEDDSDLPFQRHSRTSRGGSTRPSRERIGQQEKWMYDTLQRATLDGVGLADWQGWDIARLGSLFDQKSSYHRARIGLVWRNKWAGATPYHPIKDSGLVIRDPVSNVECTIWCMKEMYLRMPYETWAERYKPLAREIRPQGAAAE